MYSLKENILIYFKKTDMLFWLFSVLLSLFSLLLIASFSRNSNFNYFKTQFISIIFGYIGAYFVTKIGYTKFIKYWYLVAAVCLFLMFCTFLFGTSVTGGSGVDAKAWIKLPGNVTFQPSELAKIGFIITLSKHLEILKAKQKLNEFKEIVFLCLHACVPMALSHFQGDDGATIIFFSIFLFMTFISGVKIRYFVLLIVLIAGAFPILWKYVLADYQKQRLVCQLNLESDPLGMGFQQLQGKISIGSGKVFGTGLFNGPRVLNKSVPIQHSDFIFSIVGEELGFFGCILTIALLFLLIFRTLKISSTSYSSTGSNICFGFLGIVVSQTVFNLGMCLSILPVMGVTLPFLSAGGSSAACLYLGLGLIQSVNMQKNAAKIDEYLDNTL